MAKKQKKLSDKLDDLCTKLEGLLDAMADLSEEMRHAEEDK